MISIFQTSKIALRNFGKTKFRTFLTMLGIIIGVAAIIIIMSAGEGGKSLVTGQIQGIGSNLIGILPGAADDNGPPASAMGITVTTLKESDINTLKEELEEIEAASGYTRSIAKASYQNQKADVSFVGVNHQYPIIENATDKLKNGRFFTEREALGISKVVVLGADISEELFHGEDPVGRNIKIKKHTFKVIGAFEKRGTEGFLNQDTQVFIPLRTVQKLLVGIDHVSFARAKVKEGYDITFTQEKIRQILRDLHDLRPEEENDFSVRAQTTALDTLDTVLGALSYFLTAIGAISLIVGGIGIMNIMLASVNQRIKEIGLRKAIGAKEKDILTQFLIESTLLTFIGTFLGIVFGVMISYLIAITARHLGYEWTFAIPLSSLTISTLSSLAIGIGFGMYPARKAAKLNPIESLRYE